MSRLSAYRESILQTNYDFIKTRVLQTAFELDIFERIGRESKTAVTLTEEMNAQVDSLELFLNALVALGFLSSEGKAYQNTKYGLELFLKTSPLYVGDIVRHYSESSKNWVRLKESVLLNRPVEKFNLFKIVDTQAIERFAQAMHNTAMGHAELLSKKVSLSRYKTLLDLGGGPGTFTVHFLKENPNLTATIFDVPPTLKVTRKLVQDAGFLDRVTFIEGDFNRDLIKGTFDVCFLSHIIHGQGEDQNEALFRKIFALLNSKGELIVQDFFLNSDRKSPQFATLFALHMLVGTDKGRTYSFDEVERWMSLAGFTRISRSALKLPRSISLLFAEKP